MGSARFFKELTMLCLVQRVQSAEVSVASQLIAKIKKGILVFVCATPDDDDESIRSMAKKVANLRIFTDTAGKMNLSVRDIEGEVLVVSQFTLAADTSRGNRPGFSAAAPPRIARKFFDDFTQSVQSFGLDVQTGQFGADMAVSLVNDGPVTIWLAPQAR